MGLPVLKRRQAPILALLLIWRCPQSEQLIEVLLRCRVFWHLLFPRETDRPEARAEARTPSRVLCKDRDGNLSKKNSQSYLNNHCASKTKYNPTSTKLVARPRKNDGRLF